MQAIARWGENLMEIVWSPEGCCFERSQRRRWKSMKIFEQSFHGRQLDSVKVDSSETDDKCMLYFSASHHTRFGRTSLRCLVNDDEGWNSTKRSWDNKLQLFRRKLQVAVVVKDKRAWQTDYKRLTDKSAVFTTIVPCVFLLSWGCRFRRSHPRSYLQTVGSMMQIQYHKIRERQMPREV